MVPNRSGSDAPLPQLVVRLVHAAEKARGGADASDIVVADALREFGSLALWVIPNHGVFVANQRDVVASLSKIATDHLGFGEAQKALYESLEWIESEEQRDSIESAIGQLRTVSDAAYFYAGLVFGITMCDTPREGGNTRPDAVLAPPATVAFAK